MSEAASHDSLPESAGPSPARPRLWRVLKLVLTVAVLVAVGRQIWFSYQDWRTQQQATGHGVNGWWLVPAGVTYIAGLSMFGLFWRRLLAEAGVSCTRREALRAYFIGHLGKYIPGKAMVVVLRVGLLRTPERSGVTIGTTVVYETLAMMVVGAALSAATIAATAPHRWDYWGGAILAVVCLGAILHPGVFGRAAHKLTSPLRRKDTDVTPPPGYGTLIRNSVLLAAGWLLLGGSLVAVAKAIEVEFASATDPLLATGATAMATVVGFAILFLPSGLGAREFVIMVLMRSRWGASAAVAAVLLRLVWVISEFCVAGVLYRWPTRSKKA